MQMLAHCLEGMDHPFLLLESDHSHESNFSFLASYNVKNNVIIGNQYPHELLLRMLYFFLLRMYSCYLIKGQIGEESVALNYDLG